MITETITRIKLTASEGMILTNGTEYGRVVFLANDIENNWYEITEDEYNKILRKKEEEENIEFFMGEV